MVDSRTPPWKKYQGGTHRGCPRVASTLAEPAQGNRSGRFGQGKARFLSKLINTRNLLVKPNLSAGIILDVNNNGPLPVKLIAPLTTTSSTPWRWNHRENKQMPWSMSLEMVGACYRRAARGGGPGNDSDGTSCLIYHGYRWGLSNPINIPCKCHVMLQSVVLRWSGWVISYDKISGGAIWHIVVEVDLVRPCSVEAWYRFVEFALVVLIVVIVAAVSPFFPVFRHSFNTF